MRPVLPRILTLVIALFAIAGCGEDVPSAEKLQKPSNPSKAFIIGARDFRGIYANMDVDSAIYQYTTSETNTERFWKQVDDEATSADWKLVREQGRVRIYDRIRQKTGSQTFHSAEQCRIAYDESTQTVTVAWVQTDVMELPAGFPDAGSEVRFANSVIWPKFDELTR